METTLSLACEQTTNPSSIAPKMDKHKDPDLMLKSVERLTLEFVSSAEMLRTANSATDSNEQNKRRGSNSVGCASNSNNTWNEDTCPNDVSFPSVSITAPAVTSIKDDSIFEEQQSKHMELHDFAEITPTNEEQSSMLDVNMLGFYANTQANSLDVDTTTLLQNEKSFETAVVLDNSSSSSSGINFKVGGAVQTAANNTGNAFYNNPASCMSNSVLIAFEARALAENLQRNNIDELTSYSLSSLDLDNVRPPSGMESLNISGYYQQEHSLNAQVPAQRHLSPQLCMRSPKFPRKCLPAGLLAKRALGQLPAHLAGSADSVNSSCNMMLDHIKPPSLMDELLDSMISVASIQSEVADCESMDTTVSAASNYETAACGNDFDDNTVTLQSCYNELMPHDNADDDNVTPLPTDNECSSSGEHTPHEQQALLPAKVHSTEAQKILTPKQKRKILQERYKTYTIAAAAAAVSESSIDAPEDEVLEIEIMHSSLEMQTAASVSSKQTSPSVSRRRSSQERDRYKTQTIVYAIPTAVQLTEDVCSSLTSNEDCLSDDLSSIRAMTRKFKYITAPIKTHTETRKSAAAIVAETKLKLLSTKLHETDYNSADCTQNSDTESCHEMSQHNDAAAQAENGNETLSNAAHIVKAKTCLVAEKATTTAAKAVRGRKKAAYVSPYSMQYQQRQTALGTTPTTTANGMRKRAANTPTASPTKTAQKKQTNASKPTLQRQGTFVKDEPTNANVQVPVVEPTAQTSPNKSKLPTKRTTLTAANTTRGMATAKCATASRASSAAAATRRIATTPKRSNSNTALRVTSTAVARAALSSRISATTPPSRSNSNLTNTSGAAAAACGAAAKINQAQSRIANIWKRVDDIKSKQQQQKSTAPKQQQAKLNTVLNTRSPATPQQQQQQKLIRSSTFDSTPAAAKTAATKIGIKTASASKTTVASSKIAALNKSMLSNAAVARRELAAEQRK